MRKSFPFSKYFFIILSTIFNNYAESPDLVDDEHTVDKTRERLKEYLKA